MATSLRPWLTLAARTHYKSLYVTTLPVSALPRPRQKDRPALIGHLAKRMARTPRTHLPPPRLSPSARRRTWDENPWYRRHGSQTLSRVAGRGGNARHVGTPRRHPRLPSRTGLSPGGFRRPLWGRDGAKGCGVTNSRRRMPL